MHHAVFPPLKNVNILLSSLSNICPPPLSNQSESIISHHLLFSTKMLSPHILCPISFCRSSFSLSFWISTLSHVSDCSQWWSLWDSPLRRLVNEIRHDKKGNSYLEHCIDLSNILRVLWVPFQWLPLCINDEMTVGVDVLEPRSLVKLRLLTNLRRLWLKWRRQNHLSTGQSWICAPPNLSRPGWMDNSARQLRWIGKTKRRLRWTG